MALKTFTKDVDLGTTSGQYGSKGHLILTVVENSIDTSTNTSNVTATLQFKVDQYSWRASTSNWSISGYKSASGSLAYQYYSGTITLWTDTFSVEHTNDGTKTISFNISFNSTNVYSGSDSLDCALTQIPRYASITSFVVSKRDETSVNVNWNADALCDAVWYSINNGLSWVQTSGLSFVISGLSANTSYNFKIRVRRSDSQLTTDSSKVSQTTYQYPYVDSVVTSNLQIGSQQELKIYNPLGRNVTVYMKQNNTSGTTLYSGTTNKSGNNVSYKFTPTSNVLYNSIPNGTSGNAVYYCTYSNQTVQTKSGTYYMDANSSTFKPTIESNSWNYATNYVNTETIIKGKSSITVTVSSSATPYTGASIVRYIVSCGNRTATITDTTGSATITNCSDSTVNIRAVDSRGYTQDSSKLVAVISYIDQTCTVDADRTDGVGSDVFLNLSGTYYNDKLYTDSSTQADNTILSVKYAISTTSTYETDYTIPIENVTINNGNYNLTNEQIFSDGSSAGFTIGTRYNIRIKIQDRFQTKEFYGTITDGKLAVDCYQDSNGDYHRGINGLGNDNYTEYIHGDLATEGRIYQEGGPAQLPDGDGTDPVYWCSLPNGTYYYGASYSNVLNMPQRYGFVIKDGWYTTDGTKADFNVLFYQQATGKIYRTSGNVSTTTAVWVEIPSYDANGDLTIPNKLYLGSGGYEDSATPGYIHDQYGNMKHKRNNTTDSWHIDNYNGDAVFRFYVETGEIQVNNQKLISFSVKSSTPTDMNNMTESGFYFFGNISNSPCYNGYCLVMSAGTNTIKQVVFRHGTKNTNDFNTYVRTKFSDGWSNWKQII